MKMVVRLAAAILFAQAAWGAVSPEEAARLLHGHIRRTWLSIEGANR